MTNGNRPISKKLKALFLAGLLLILGAAVLYRISYSASYPSGEELNRVDQRFQQYHESRYGPSAAKLYAAFFAKALRSASDHDMDMINHLYGHGVGASLEPVDMAAVGRISKKMDSYFMSLDSLSGKGFVYDCAHVPDFAKQNTVMSFTGKRALLSISESQMGEAAEWLNRSMRLNLALFPSSYESTRAAIRYLNQNLEAYEWMIWMDIPSSIARRSLKDLNSVAPFIYRLDPALSAYLDSFRDIKQLVEGADPFSKKKWNEIYPVMLTRDSLMGRPAGNVMAMQFAKRGNQQYVDLLTREMKSNHLKALQMTYVPGFNKHVRNWVRNEPNFSVNPVFSREELLHLSPQLVFLMQYRQATLWADMNRWDMISLKERYERLRLALAAHIYREDKGRDPESVPDLVPAYIPVIEKQAVKEFTLVQIPDTLFWARELVRNALPPNFRTVARSSLAASLNPEWNPVRLNLSGNTLTITVAQGAYDLPPAAIVARLGRFRSIVNSAELTDEPKLNEKNPSFVFALQLKKDLRPMAVMSLNRGKVYEDLPREKTTLVHF